MGDILIRNIPDRLKEDVQNAARKSGRSISEEAKLLIEKGLRVETMSAPGDAEAAYNRMREAFLGAQMDDDEHLEFHDVIRKSKYARLESDAPDFS
jgi:antitoxin FitA